MLLVLLLCRIYYHARVLYWLRKKSNIVKLVIAMLYELVLQDTMNAYDEFRSNLHNQGWR